MALKSAPVPIDRKKPISSLHTPRQVAVLETAHSPKQRRTIKLKVEKVEAKEEHSPVTVAATRKLREAAIVAMEKARRV